MDLTKGTKLGPYEILAPLGAGGMGEVYRARDTRLDREVAIKVLPEALANEQRRLARFEREAKLLASLNHPSIATIFSVEEAGNDKFITMELIEGESLDKLIPAEGFALATLFDLAIPLADAVAAAHEQGVIHRDLKPANIMVSRTGLLKVLDFGLAKASVSTRQGGGDSALPTRAPLGFSLTKEGAVLGTVEYMAPEQAMGEKADVRADVFSLGVVLYEMTTGRRPFTGARAPGVLTAVLRDAPRPVNEIRPGFPTQLSWLISRCLEKDPERRVQTSKDVRNELVALQEFLVGGRSEAADTIVQPPEATVMERRFILTTEILRRLSERSPRLIGRAMTYLDNRVESSDLVVLVHGLGGDQRQFEAALPAIPARAVAPTLVGFEPEASSRPPLGVEDDSRLLRAFLQDLHSRLRPVRTILLGFSSGADQCLRLAASEEGPGVSLTGLIALGPNIDSSTCFFTRRLVGLPMDDPGAILETLKDIGRDITSLEEWLTLQLYVVTCFSKLGSDLDVLKRYAADIVAPFDADDDPLPGWFRTASERTSYLRMVFGNGSEAASAEALLARHLENNVLGDRFTETTCVLEPMHRIKLAEPDVIVRYVREVLEATKPS